MDNAITVLAGATGNLGGRIARAILKRGANVRAIVRHNSDPEKVEELRKRGAAIAEVDFNSVPELTEACSGGSCVISALSGLRDVIVETQTLLLDAAVKAGVPRFIPSDYSIDFTKLTSWNEPQSRSASRIPRAPRQGPDCGYLDPQRHVHASADRRGAGRPLQIQAGCLLGGRRSATGLYDHGRFR